MSSVKYYYVPYHSRISRAWNPTFSKNIYVVPTNYRGLLLLSRFSRVQLCVTPKMAAHQPPPAPWDSPGKNTGVGCHSPLQCMKVKLKVKSLSCVPLLATPWPAAYQAPPSMGFSRWEYWSGLPLPSPNYLGHYAKYFVYVNRLIYLPKILCALVTQSCLTLCDPLDCSPPGSSVPGIFQARILEWVAISFSRGSSRPRDWTRGFPGCSAGKESTCKVGDLGWNPGLGRSPREGNSYSLQYSDWRIPWTI